MKYSIIVPVFNRPDEVDELLESLTHQTEKDFEVVIVEDGSQTPCEEVCKRYENLMDIHYYYKETGKSWVGRCEIVVFCLLLSLF